MAPPSIPAPLRLLGGDGLGKDRSGRTVVSVPSERVPPTMPTGLPPEAKREWQRIVPLLDELHVLAGALHRAVLHRYVTAWADYIELQAEVRKNGRFDWVVVRDSAGTETMKRIVKVEVKLLADARSELHRLTGELGLSPATEAKAYASAQSNKAKEDDGVPNPFAGGAS